MSNNVSIIDLCEALSDIFIDNEVDYNYIASIAKNFPTGLVEYILFEWIAPVCYPNLSTPIPSVWAGFNRNELWKDIIAYRSQSRKNSFITRLKKRHLRRELEPNWLMLKKLL